ncbi:MAG: peptidyl-prolyl cis-trans isomerase [bacterium]
MLEKVRNNVKSRGVQIVIVVVVVAFIGTIFLVWGHGGKQEHRGTVLAKVYENEITYPEYQQEFYQLTQQYRKLYKDQWSDELVERLQLKRLAFDNIVNHYILFHKSLEWGIPLTDEEVMNYIKSLPAFQMNGVFNSDLYRQRLSMERIDPQEFENDIKRHLLFKKVQEKVTGGFNVTDQELEQRFRKNNERIKAKYLILPFEKLTSQVEVSLEELKAYYEANKDKYRYAERRTIELLFIDPRDFQADAQINDEEINRYYNRHQSQFLVRKQIKASHILLNVNPDTQPDADEKIKEKAVGLLKRIEAGEDFQELAKTYSDCPSSKRGGDLGYFGKGKMDPEFEKAAFALGIGEVSQVIKSSFGYHIIKVQDIKPEHIKPLDEVRDQIVRALKTEKGKELARLKMEDMVRKMYKGKFMREFALEDRVNYKTEGPFLQGQPIPLFGKDKSAMDAIFSLEIDQISRIVEGSKGLFVFRLVSIDPPREMTYKEVETRVERETRMEKAKHKAIEEAEMLRQRLIENPDIQSLANSKALQAFDTGEFKRGEYISGLGNLDDQQMQMLFSLQSGEISPVMETQQGFAIFKITEKINIDEREFERYKDVLRSQLLQVRQQELFNAWVDRVKKEINIEIYHQDLIS